MNVKDLVHLMKLCPLRIVAISLALLAFRSALADDFAEHHYPDFTYLPAPSEYGGRVFRLSQRFPTKRPDAADKPDFMRIDYKKDWRKYLLEARAYCFQGNTPGDDVEDHFDVAMAESPEWFHMPWQHYGPNGREGVHGLTKEAKVEPKQLAPTQSYDQGQVYAVGFYNRFGGYTIGKVWEDETRPQARHSQFAPGTVIFKLLFTDVPVQEVPSLENPLLWEAYVTKEFESTQRDFKRLALLQMDLMVRDDNAPSGWIFGTYQYNGELAKANKWENLAPLGVQWGNDPTITTSDFTNATPEKTRINPDIKESVINPDVDELPIAHLGWNGRLNGPADNPRSSCMSCHMTAQSPPHSPLSPLFLPKEDQPEVGSQEWNRWFQNIGAGEKFDRDAAVVSTDFCLQMTMSIQSFHEWRNAGTKWKYEKYRGRQRAPQLHEEKADTPVQR